MLRPSLVPALLSTLLALAACRPANGGAPTPPEEAIVTSPGPDQASTAPSPTHPSDVEGLLDMLSAYEPLEVNAATVDYEREAGGVLVSATLVEVELEDAALSEGVNRALRAEMLGAYETETWSADYTGEVSIQCDAVTVTPVAVAVICDVLEDVYAVQDLEEGTGGGGVVAVIPINLAIEGTGVRPIELASLFQDGVDPAQVALAMANAQDVAWAERDPPGADGLLAGVVTDEGIRIYPQQGGCVGAEEDPGCAPILIAPELEPHALREGTVLDGLRELRLARPID